MPGPEDTYASYGRSCANLSNTPFRFYKRWVHEGGIASPVIVSWPAGGVEGNVIIDGAGHVIDIVPTILDALDASADTPGVSLLPLWRREGSGAERTLCWEHIGNAAIRRGTWKLVRETFRPWELYDIVADRGETRNLIAENPDLAQRLEAEWQRWADANGVLPWDAVLADYSARGRPAPSHE